MTRVEKEIDRINHFDVCNANTESVFLTYRRSSQIDEVVNSWIENSAPTYDITTSDGIGHMLWIINDNSLIQKISQWFENIPSLYIADGHHRSASAFKVGMKRREQFPNYNGSEEFNYFMAVVFPDEDLKIFDYNRVIKDLNGYTNQEFITELEKAGFTVRIAPEAPYYPSHKHIFSMYLDGDWYQLEASDKICPEDVIGNLDVSILQENVLAPLLGIKDPRTDKRIDFVGGIRGLEELERR